MLERAERKAVADRVADLEALLETPPFPMSLFYIWDAYWRLRSRKANAFDLSPIEWPDISAFVLCSGVRLRPWEIDLLCDVDDIFLRVARQKDK